MFKAMQSGAGSLSTVHAHSAHAAIERLVTCAMEAGQHVTAEFAYRQIAQHVNLIVHVERREGGYDPDAPVRRQRRVAQIVALEPGERGMPASTDVFEERSGAGLVPASAPTWIGELAAHGYDPRTHRPGGPA